MGDASKTPAMPAVLTLYCQHCGELIVLRDAEAQFGRDQFRRDGRDVEFGDTVRISSCGAPACNRAEFIL